METSQNGDSGEVKAVRESPVLPRISISSAKKEGRRKNSARRITSASSVTDASADQEAKQAGRTNSSSYLGASEEDSKKKSKKKKKKDAHEEEREEEDDDSSQKDSDEVKGADQEDESCSESNSDKEDVATAKRKATGKKEKKDKKEKKEKKEKSLMERLRSPRGPRNPARAHTLIATLPETSSASISQHNHSSNNSSNSSLSSSATTAKEKKEKKTGGVFNTLTIPALTRRKRTISTGARDALALSEETGSSRRGTGRAAPQLKRSQDDSAIPSRHRDRDQLDSRTAISGVVSVSPRPLTSRVSSTSGIRDQVRDALESSDTDEDDDPMMADLAATRDISEMKIDLPPSFTDLSLAERIEVRVVHLLYNPRSGNKTGEKVMRNAKKLFEDKYGKTVEVTKLQYKGHAEELCETMSLDGIDVLCSVGGDGTFHECINGMMKRIRADGSARIPPMALIAAGTGNSFMHELGCAKLKNAVHHICRGVHVPIDICKLTFGDATSCYSFNSMHWGMASKVAVTAEKLRWMGTAIRYTTAALIEMMKGKTARARITITDGDDNVITYDEDFALAIANNIITAGKGMKMAPTAKLDDGLIDLLLITTASTLDMMTIFRKVYDGSHTKLPHVRYIKVKSFSIVPYRTVNEEKRERERPNKSGSSKSSSELLSTGDSSSTSSSSSSATVSSSPAPKKGRGSDTAATIAQSAPAAAVSAGKKGKERAADDAGPEGEQHHDETTPATTTSTATTGGGGGELKEKEETSSQHGGSGSHSSIEEIEELLDVDGELKGCTPFTCDVIPRALRVIL